MFEIKFTTTSLLPVLRQILYVTFIYFNQTIQI